MQLEDIAPPPAVPWRAYAALAIGVVCIALSAIWVKWANVPGSASAFYRMAIAAVPLIPWWLARRPAHLPRKATLLALLGGIFFAVDLLLWNTAILMTSAANSTLLANNAPLWVGLGTLLIFRQRLPRSFWWGMALALVGVLLILGGDIVREPTLGQGDLLSISAGMFYAAYLLTTQSARSELDTLTFMTLGIVVSVVVLFAASMFFNAPLTGYSGKTWGALLGLGLVSHLGGWLAINYALGYIKASVASVSLLGQPVLTAVISIPLLGEGLALEQIVGGALVLGGIWVVHR
ncbi:MAG: DMT family transporter [Herpetosiphonaceae bacterium]|nr:DMT family transporter [Herpetosiphonaceae bacterium]